MAGYVDGHVTNWFTPNEELSKAVSSGVAIDTYGISAVYFTDGTGAATAVGVTIGSFGTPFPLEAGVALGIDGSTETITFDADGIMFAMGR